MRSSLAQAGDAGATERKYLVAALVKIADPVLEALSRGELHKLMPVETNGAPAARKMTSHLEAFGRLFAGMAPWLELGPDATDEGRLRRKYIDLTIACIKNAVDPSSPDFMNFTRERQPLVDAAFFAQGLLRSETQIWQKLDKTTRNNVLTALTSSRVIIPGYNNWLMFSATVEAALLHFGNQADRMRMDYALKQLSLWYKGDGAYGDGPEFHYDYYNSFVMQPMLLETLQALIQNDSSARNIKTMYVEVTRRAKRYAVIQERLISPEGTYPPIGRSLAYRFGAFHLLAKVVLMHELPESLAPQQVRAALYTVIKRQMEAQGTFDKQGWLQVGMYGHQPGIGETYISTGSLYLCAEAFLVLGLPANDVFWQGDDKEWTASKIWNGENINTDHALESSSK